MSRTAGDERCEHLSESLSAYIAHSGLLQYSISLREHPPRHPPRFFQSYHWHAVNKRLLPFLSLPFRTRVPVADHQYAVLLP